jgi:tyrosine-protein phosphatase non-receptor type 4
LAKGGIGRLFKIKSAFKNNHFDNQYFGFQKRAKGHVLLELVYQHLELIEKDYFGLQFSDNGMPPTTENSDVMVRHCFSKRHLLC